MYLKGIDYVLMIIFIMIIAGLAKDYHLFSPVYSYIKNTFGNNRFVLVILSAIGGVLPIEGRVTVSAGILDTVVPKCGHGREKMGIVDYLSTHHYYLWSPLEKTVIIPIAAFGLTYWSWINMIFPLLAMTFVFIAWYIWFVVKEEELIIDDFPFKISAVVRNVVPMAMAIAAYIYGVNFIFCFGALTLYYMLITQQWNIQNLNNYIKWDLILLVIFIIIAGNYFKEQQSYFQDLIKNAGVDITTLGGLALISLIGFIASFFMGSSGKFIAIAVLMTQLFGTDYFLWFFAIDYAGYLLSPTHKCVVVGNRYFGTPLTTYYKALGTWSALLVLTAGIITFG